MNANQNIDIRAEFLNFFASKGHTIVPSAPLVPDDASLLFTNAGMVPFKSIFTGEIPRPNPPRNTSCQTCIRAGGKHNDLDNVGYTARHHTFFEMLGNFSFGDYFKEEVIDYAWEFVTQVLKFDKNLLYVTIHESDDEAYGLWCKHIAPERIKRMGDKDNFWQMGETGPCGPCSEIYVDQGEKHFNGEEDYFGGEGDRFLEIWNLVFMQYERDKEGNLHPLPRPSIDTGMGLERVAALKENEFNNFDTSLFKPLMDCIEKLTGLEYISDNPRDNSKKINQITLEFADSVFDNSNTQPQQMEKRLDWKERQAGFRVIADHARSVAFLLAQGVGFDKEGRGYVLRRILRRAVRHGYLLGLNKPFLYEVVGKVCENMGNHYGYLLERKNVIMEQCKNEETRFFETIGVGISLFNNELARILPHKILDLEVNFGKELICKIITHLPNDYIDNFNSLSLDEIRNFAKDISNVEDVKLLIRNKNKEMHFDETLTPIIFSGEIAFKLYDTYGFPLDLTQDMLKNYGIELDLIEFEKCMEEQKVRAKASWKGSGDKAVNGDFKILLEKFGENEFIGYEKMENESKILALLDEDFKCINELKSGEIGWVMLDFTPFYAISGGQVGDTGFLDNSEVLDTQKFFGLNLSAVRASKTLKVNDKVKAHIDEIKRAQIARHHSATHLLHYALREILGTHIAQAGSLVEFNKLRFDFTHPNALTSDELDKIEKLVNECVIRADNAILEKMSLDEAKKSGAIALFNEKYQGVVRVLTLGASKELCGGTHIKNTAEIGSFYITKESGVSSGVRRIEAVASLAALNYAKSFINEVKELKFELKTNDISNALKKLKEQNAEFKNKLKNAAKSELVSIDINSTRVCVARIDEGDIKAMCDDFKNAYEKAVILLVQVKDGKIMLAAGAKNAPIKAGELVKAVAAVLGGSGGGRDDFATAGGKDISQIQNACELALKLIKDKL